MAVIIRPSAAAAKVLPGEDLTLQFTVTNAPADPALTATLLSDSGGVFVTSLETFREVRVPLTEAEVLEFPPFPPSIREQARRNGRLELVSSVRSEGGGPIAVAARETVVATIEISAQKKGGVVLGGTLVLEGERWGRNTAPVAALVGTGAAEVTPVPARISTNVLPGESVEREVAIHRAPTEATVVAVVDTASPHVRLARLTATRVEHAMFTEEELLELPPAMRERARRLGYEVDIPVGAVGPGEPLTVPRRGRLQAFVTLDPPAGGGAGGLSGQLVIESNNWRRIDVPITPVVGEVRVSLSADRVEVRQGESASAPVVRLESVSGPATDVVFDQQWAPESRWSITPGGVRLEAGATLDVPLTFAVAATTDPGSYRIDLRTIWFDGMGEMVFPMTLVVLPGKAEVIPLQPRLSGQQGSTVLCPVELRLTGRKVIHFRPGLLPPGVAMRPPAQTGFERGNRAVNLEFQIEPFALPNPDHRVTVDWSSPDGASGALELRLAILLRPAERVFEQRIVTEDGVALAGSARLLLRNDGTGHYSGEMRATGGLSYDFRVRSIVHSANGAIVVAAQEAGSVHGTFDFGDRSHVWSRPIVAEPVRTEWQGVLNGAMIVSTAHRVGGIFGTLRDVVVDTLQFLGARGLLSSVPGGQLISAIVFIGSEISDLAGLDVVGPGGVSGVLFAGGAAVLLGPAWAIPVFVGGAIAGELTIRSRKLEPHERTFAEAVFGGSLDFDNILLTNLTGAGDRAFVSPSNDGTVLVNIGEAVFDDPTGRATPSYPVKGQLLIHELTHAWQIQHKVAPVQFLWDALLQKLGADGDYNYGPPGPPWSEAFGLEAQASVVDEWFAGADGHAVVKMPDRPGMNVNDPYFRYIRDNIQRGEP